MGPVKTQLFSKPNIFFGLRTSDFGLIIMSLPILIPLVIVKLYLIFPAMKNLLNKLNYRGQKRIAVINANEIFLNALSKEISDVVIDVEIDNRYPYEFMLIFVELVSEVEQLAPKAMHNLISDGILWFAYPKKTSKKYSSDIDRDHGWEILIERGFDKVRQVAVNDDWSALRFMNIRYIKSSRNRFS
jgi:hypothetical protein